MLTYTLISQDFDKIIRNPLENQRDGHVDYVKEMELFRHFPCDVLVEDSQDFFYQYFKPDDMILTNSNQSDYLVIVLSVSTYVLRGHLFKNKNCLFFANDTR